MPNPFFDTFLPSLAGSASEAGAGYLKGQVQGMEAARQLALLDAQIKQQQLANQQAQQAMNAPKLPQFHNLGAGAFVRTDPSGNIIGDVNRPPQALPPELQILSLMQNPDFVKAYQNMQQIKNPPQPTILHAGDTLLPPSSTGMPSAEPQPAGASAPAQPYTAPARPTGSPTDQVLDKYKSGQTLNKQEQAILDIYMERNKPKLSGGQAALDTAFAKDYADWVAGGGYADVQKQLGQLKGASQALATDTSLTGPVRGLIPDSVRNVTNPAAIAIRDQVMEVVQRNLRMILGPQFTEREGMMLMRRAYNEQQPPAENKKRVDRLIKQIGDAAKAKADAAQYFEQHGTLQGWKGKLPSIGDFNPEVASIGEGVGRPKPSGVPLQGAGRARMVAPPVGAVVGGYRFKGGNPADKANWEAVGG